MSKVSEKQNVLSEVGRVVRDIARELSSEPNKLTVEEHERDGRVTISMWPSAKDYGRIVGSRGATINALELLAKVMADRKDLEMQISVIPPDSREKPPRDKFAPNPKWGKADIGPLLKRVCALLFEGGTVEFDDVNPLVLNASVKVSAKQSELIEIMQDGRHVNFIFDKTTRETTTIDLDLVAKALRMVFNGIGKSHGKSFVVYVDQIYIPDAQ